MHKVQAKGILSAKNGMNVYRGCQHGCIYCDSRSTCYNMNHEFEDIEVKENAPELLEMALRSKKKHCMIGTGSMCDPYMPLEASMNVTRHCNEIIEKYGFGLTVITKSDYVLRDIDLFKRIHKKAKCVIQMTLTTASDELCRKIEPNVCVTSKRAEALYKLRNEGIPTVVWISPILPYINDTKENLEALLDICIKAKVKGIICFGMGVTLRDGNRDYFYNKLDEQFPGLKNIYIERFKDSYSILSDHNDELMEYFEEVCKKHSILYTPEACFAYLNEFPNQYEQESLFKQLII